MELKTEIYYFTGTGNTLAVAKSLVKETGGKVISMASKRRTDRVHSAAEAIGILYPVYYAGPPAIVKDFLAKLAMEGKPYIFAVATFGGAAGLSFALLREKAQTCGFDLDACFGIHMPQNAFKKSWEKKEGLLKYAAKRTAAVARMIAQRKKGVYSANPPLELMMKPFNRMIRKASQKAIAGFAGASEEIGFDALIRLGDHSFLVADACNGCNVCADVCPAGNIEIKDGKPVFDHRCENCLACAHWCPQHAILGGVISEYRYLHPDVKIEDMKMQKGG